VVKEANENFGKRQSGGKEDMGKEKHGEIKSGSNIGSVGLKKEGKDIGEGSDLKEPQNQKKVNCGWGKRDSDQ